MAKFNVEVPKDLMDMFSKLENQSTDIIKEACNEAIAVVVPKVRLSTPVRNHDLQNSLKTYKASEKKSGAISARFRFSGYDRNGVPNALKGFVLEYGSRAKSHTQAKKPFLRPAMESSQNEMAEAIEKVFEKYQK